MIAGAKVTFIVEIARRQDRGQNLFVSKHNTSHDGHQHEDVVVQTVSRLIIRTLNDLERSSSV